jgi:hypothetical protein
MNDLKKDYDLRDVSMRKIMKWSIYPWICETRKVVVVEKMKWGGPVIGMNEQRSKENTENKWYITEFCFGIKERPCISKRGRYTGNFNKDYKINLIFLFLITNQSTNCHLSWDMALSHGGKEVSIPRLNATAPLKLCLLSLMLPFANFVSCFLDIYYLQQLNGTTVVMTRTVRFSKRKLRVFTITA